MSNQSGNGVWVPRLGDRVRLRGPRPMNGRIIELRGNLGPGGVDIFGVELANFSQTYTEVRGDQLEFLDDEKLAPQPAPSATE